MLVDLVAQKTACNATTSMTVQTRGGVNQGMQDCMNVVESSTGQDTMHRE